MLPVSMRTDSRAGVADAGADAEGAAEGGVQRPEQKARRIRDQRRILRRRRIREMKVLWNRRSVLVATLAALAASPALAWQAPADPPSEKAADGAFARVPFGPGEVINYTVELGFFGRVGKGSIAVGDLVTLRGHSTYPLTMELRGRVTFARVEDEYKSWLDAKRLLSLRFHKDVEEVRYKRKQTFDFFPEEKRWVRADKPSEFGALPTDEPLDDLSFLYFVRTLPLEVGKTYTLNRYFKDDGNPVTVQVMRKQQVTVPAGTFNTIVVRPIIKTKGLFGEGGEAEVFFTDDDRRIPVQITTKVKVLKSLNMYMDSFTPGQRLVPR